MSICSLWRLWSAVLAVAAFANCVCVVRIANSTDLRHSSFLHIFLFQFGLFSAPRILVYFFIFLMFATARQRHPFGHSVCILLWFYSVIFCTWTYYMIASSSIYCTASAKQFSIQISFEMPSSSTSIATFTSLARLGTEGTTFLIFAADLLFVQERHQGIPNLFCCGPITAQGSNREAKLCATLSHKLFMSHRRALWTLLSKSVWRTYSFQTLFMRNRYCVFFCFCCCVSVISDGIDEMVGVLTFSLLVGSGAGLRLVEYSEDMVISGHQKIFSRNSVAIKHSTSKWSQEIIMPPSFRTLRFVIVFKISWNCAVSKLNSFFNLAPKISSFPNYAQNLLHWNGLFMNG